MTLWQCVTLLCVDEPSFGAFLVRVPRSAGVATTSSLEELRQLSNQQLADSIACIEHLMTSMQLSERTQTLLGIPLTFGVLKTLVLFFAASFIGFILRYLSIHVAGYAPGV